MSRGCHGSIGDHDARWHKWARVNASGVANVLAMNAVAISFTSHMDGYVAPFHEELLKGKTVRNALPQRIPAEKFFLRETIMRLMFGVPAVCHRQIRFALFPNGLYSRYRQAEVIRDRFDPSNRRAFATSWHWSEVTANLSQQDRSAPDNPWPALGNSCWQGKRPPSRTLPQTVHFVGSAMAGLLLDFHFDGLDRQRRRNTYDPGNFNQMADLNFRWISKPASYGSHTEPQAFGKLCLSNTSGFHESCELAGHDRYLLKISNEQPTSTAINIFFIGFPIIRDFVFHRLFPKSSCCNHRISSALRTLGIPRHRSPDDVTGRQLRRSPWQGILVSQGLVSWP